MLLFSEEYGIQRTPEKGCCSCVVPVRIVTVLPGIFGQLTGVDYARRLSVPCQELCVTSPCLAIQFRNLNLILFPLGPVRLSVRPTHPSLITSAKEPLSFRRRRFSLLFRSYYRLDQYCLAVHLLSQAGFAPRGTLGYFISLLVLGRRLEQALGTQFRLVYFGDGSPRSVRCYPFLGGWVLLVLPPLC